MRKIVFENINFLDLTTNNFKKIIKENGLFVFPAATALVKIKDNDSKKYYSSLKKADYVFFDSGFFVLLLRILKNINVSKFSGYKFLKFFFHYLKSNKQSIFLIDPNINFSKNNFMYIKNLGIKKKDINNYVAPLYEPNNLYDVNLIKKINTIKPKVILINIGGGTQEILGLYIQKNLKFKAKIICTGAAISFFTGDQAPINNFIDKYYLGWVIRFLFNPIRLFNKYFKTIKLIKIVLRAKTKTFEL